MLRSRHPQRPETVLGQPPRPGRSMPWQARVVATAAGVLGLTWVMRQVGGLATGVALLVLWGVVLTVLARRAAEGVLTDAAAAIQADEYHATAYDEAVPR